MVDIENPPIDQEKKGCCVKLSTKKKDQTKTGTTSRSSLIIEFRDFVLGGNLIRIGVAFVFALAIAEVVKSFVHAFITPILGIIGARDLEDLFFNVRDSKFRYGIFLDSLISFITICIVVFFLLILPLQRYCERYVPGWVSRSCPYCFTSMPAIGTKCPACTSAVEPLDVIHDKEG